MHKILIIDDEPAILDMYKLKLEQSGYSVITSTDGTAGLQLAQEHQPDVILLDIVMPKFNGFDVLKALKEDQSTKNIPVFITTNLPTQTNGDKAKSLGAVNYLVKAEYEPGMVADIINRYLRDRGQERAKSA